MAALSSRHLTMATCPRCKGHLTDSHRCPRSRAAIAAEIVVAALGGGFAALLLVALLDPAGQARVEGVAIVLGALAGAGLDHLLRR